MDTKNVVTGVWPTLVFANGEAALKFLTEGLGFTLSASYAGTAPGSVAHAELTWPTGGGVMVSSSDAKDEPDEFSAFAGRTQSVYLVHDDPDRVFAAATAAGATVVRAMREEDYRSRGFTIADPEGNLWSVGTYGGESSTGPPR
jgi:uncharacterized glyoxalase superfamily protein PhnB